MPRTTREKLIEILMNSREKKIGFILSNEYRDVLIELIRSRSFIEIRLGLLDFDERFK